MYSSLIQSPLNYTGGKFKLLPQILPHFPKDIDTFHDLFAGGCNVGINISANKIIFNDINQNLLYIYNTFKNLDDDIIFEMIDDVINKYDLSKSNINGYDFYNCNSAVGLGEYNRERFLKLRYDFNFNINKDYYYYIVLFVLIVFSFNNQIRFNKNYQFNLPVGKRDFNNNMQKKLSAFIERLKTGDNKFTSTDFRNYNIDELSKNNFVYADPPYLITTATYNEQDSWNENLEKDLLFFLDSLNERKIKFALSNVVKSSNKTNSILIDWAKKYKTINLDFNYANSNYQKKDKANNTEEVLIINY